MGPWDHGTTGELERGKAGALDGHGQGKLAKSIVETNLRGNGNPHHDGKMGYCSGPRSDFPTSVQTTDGGREMWEIQAGMEPVKLAKAGRWSH